MVCCGVLWLVCGGWSFHDMTIVCVEMDGWMCARRLMALVWLVNGLRLGSCT